MTTSISRRRFIAGASATAACAALGTPPAARADNAISLRISSSLTADQNSAHYIWFQRFSGNLKAVAGSRIATDFFPNSQLGKEADVVQQVKVGSIDIMLTGSSIWATVAPEFGMLDLGYVFDSYAHMAKALDGGVGASLAEILHKRTACTVLGWGSHFAARSVYTKAPVTSRAELKGVKLRVLPTSAFIETFKLMGAVPTPIPFNELYTAVQTGVVEGFEHDASTVLATKLYEVTRHCFLTEHLFPPMVAIIGKRGFDRIPADLRTAMAQAAQEASLNQRALAAEKGSAAFAELKKLGMSFHPMDKAERAALRNQMQTQLWPAFASQYPVTLPLFKSIDAAR
jgi:tripartite ATP-independent transporter DctP family solute receptor